MKMLITFPERRESNHCVWESGSPTESNLKSRKRQSHRVHSSGFSPLLGRSAVLAPTNSGTLANPVNVAGELALRSLSMAKFDNRELSCDLPSTPTSSGPLVAFGKQWRVRGGWASGDDSLPGLMKIHDREQTGGEVRMGEKETSDMALGSM